MDRVEQLLKENCKKDISNYVFDNFKKNQKPLFDVVIKTLHEINLQRLKTDYMIMLRPDITKITLKVDVRKNFLFGGNFIRDNKKVSVLERIDTFGTYFVDDIVVVNKLRNYKIGERIGLVKTDEGKINLVLGEEVTGSLFD